MCICIYIYIYIHKIHIHNKMINEYILVEYIFNHMDADKPT